MYPPITERGARPASWLRPANREGTTGRTLRGTGTHRMGGGQ
jgi:hypothetical protein